MSGDAGFARVDRIARRAGGVDGLSISGFALLSSVEELRE